MKSVFGLIVSCVLLAACGEQAPKSAFPSDMNVVHDDSAHPAVLGQIVTRSEVLRADTMTANFDFVDVDPKCRAPRASRRAKVAYVYTYGGVNDVPIHHVEAENNKATNALRQEFMKLAISEMTGNSFAAGMMGREFAQFQMSNQLESPGAHRCAYHRNGRACVPLSQLIQFGAVEHSARSWRGTRRRRRGRI